MLRSGEYTGITNSPLAEQKNAQMRKLETQAAYMKQFTFLFYVRYFLHRLNKLEDEAAAGQIFWRSSKTQGQL